MGYLWGRCAQSVSVILARGRGIMSNIRNNAYCVCMAIFGVIFLALSLTGVAIADAEQDKKIDGKESVLRIPITEGRIATRNGIDSFNRLGAPPEELPYTLDVVDVEALEDQGGNRIRNIAEFVPGVEAASSGGSNQEDLLFIRGFESLLIAVNGLPRANFDESPESLANIERVEIIKGSAALEGGLVGPGGAINLVTKKPQFISQQRFELSIGSHRQQRLEFDTTGPIAGTQTLAYRFIASGERGESFRDEVETERLLIAPSLAWHYAPGAEILLETSYYYANTPLDDGVFFLPGAGLEDDFAPPEFFYGETGDFNKNKRERVALFWTHPLPANITARLSAEYRSRERRSRSFNAFPADLYANGFEPPYEFSGDPFQFRDELIERPNNNHNRSIQLELRGDHRTGVFGHSWVAGALLAQTTNDRDQFFTNRFTVINVFDPEYGQEPQPFDDDISRSIFFSTLRTESQFAQYKLDVGDWHLLAGLRRDDVTFDDIFQGFFDDNSEDNQFGDPEYSWRLGGVWDASKYIGFFSGVSTGFLPQPGLTRNGNVTGARRNQSADFGIRYSALAQRVVGSMALYVIRQTDVAEFDPANGPGESFLRETGELRSRGVEWTSRYRPGPDWNITATATYTHARIENNNEGLSGKSRYNVPTFSTGLRGFLQLTRLGLPNTGVDLSLRHVDQRPGDDNNTFTLPAYTRVDFGVAHQFDDKVSLRVFAENLFNERYYPFSANRVWQVYPGAPRQVALALTYEP